MSPYLPLQKVLARLLIDAQFRAAFHERRSDGGLTPAEAELLRRVDPRKLEIVSEGYTGKRFERVASSYPLTLQVLDLQTPGHRRRYLVETPFPAHAAEERGAFARYYARAPFLASDLARMVRDLLLLEASLRDAGQPSGAGYRLRPRASRPARSAACAIVGLEGPLGEALAALPSAVPYPAAPAEYIAVAEGGRPILERLTAESRALLDACDGSRLLEELEARSSDAPATLARWFRRGVLTDAAAPDAGCPVR